MRALAADLQALAGVTAAAVAKDHLRIRGEKVHDATHRLIAPLGAYNCDNFCHGQSFIISWYSSRYFFAAAAQELSTIIPLRWIFCQSSGRA